MIIMQQQTVIITVRQEQQQSALQSIILKQADLPSQPQQQIMVYQRLHRASADGHQMAISIRQPYHLPMMHIIPSECHIPIWQEIRQQHLQSRTSM